MRVAVIRIFAFRVRMMDDQTEPRPTGAARRPLQHFEIAVGVTKSRDRTAADMLVDTDWLSRLVVDEIDLGQPEKRWCAVFHLKSSLDRRSNDLFWRHAVDPLGPWPHELDTAT